MESGRVGAPGGVCPGCSGLSKKCTKRMFFGRPEQPSAGGFAIRRPSIPSCKSCKSCQKMSGVCVLLSRLHPCANRLPAYQISVHLCPSRRWRDRSVLVEAVQSPIQSGVMLSRRSLGERRATAPSGRSYNRSWKWPLRSHSSLVRSAGTDRYGLRVRPAPSAWSRHSAILQSCLKFKRTRRN